jgi:hypothetical protein
MQVICKLLDKQVQQKELTNKKHQQYFHSTSNNNKKSYGKKVTTVSFGLVAT